MARRGHSSLVALALAAVALAACSEEEAPPGPGIAVTVDLDAYAGQVATLKIAISAAPDGFVPHPLEGIDDGGRVETEDVDGDGVLELVVSFTAPRSPLSFRVETGNMIDLTVRGQAFAFDSKTLIAGADWVDATLPAFGRGELALTLSPRSGGAIGPDTRTTDLRTVEADVAIGSSDPAGLFPVAVCDVDGDGQQDLVIGAPQAEDLGLAVGGVYVLFGGGGLGRQINLAEPTSAMGFRFFGQFAGDRLGASVACADLTGDGVDDLIVGAPGAGRVYAVFGDDSLFSRQVMPGTTGDTAPDVTWQAGADVGFGMLLFAADLDGDDRAEILAATPGNQKVHLLRGVTQPAAAPINVDGTGYVTISNVRANALAAGHLRNPTGIDIVIGDSDARMPGFATPRGAIYAFAVTSLADTTAFDVLSGDPDLAPDLVIWGPESSQFGAAVLVLDTTGGGQDLIVGAPNHNDGTGHVYLYEGDSALYDINPRMYEERSDEIAGPIAGGRFGGSLAGAPSGAGRSWSSFNLVVGASSTGHGDRPLAGAAYLFGGGQGWEFPLYEQVFGASAGDQLGTVVAGGPINQSDTEGDLVAVAPGAADGRGVVYIRFKHDPPQQ